MLKNKAFIRFIFFISLLIWIIWIILDWSVLLNDLRGLPADVPQWLPRALFNFQVIVLFYYYQLRIEKDETLSFSDLLWKVFAVGVIATLISLALRLIIFLLGSTKLTTNIFFIDLIHQIHLALLMHFLLVCFHAWKRFILYQKSKWLIRSWIIFSLLLLTVLIFGALPIVIPKLVQSTIIIAISLIGIILSLNMRWVAYLNFKQKWTGLLLLLLSIFYLIYFIYSVNIWAETIRQQSAAFVDFQSSTFNITLTVFVFAYMLFSFLVILFNLPTSSVFEQKLEEAINFQRISQSIQTEQNEESVYTILLESSVKAVFADAAWLEITRTNDHKEIYCFRITSKEATEIHNRLQSTYIRTTLEYGLAQITNKSIHLRKLKNARFRSLLAFPIKVKEQTIGTLTLLKELPDGFNKEMTRIVSAFANQAGISIENFRLLEEAFQNARYKEELKIAKKVQQSLLPTQLEQDTDFEISAFSASADEVGGDYYDTLRINPSEIALIIADVSGKGTTAAFHMSQMKGIFLSLAQTSSDPKYFIDKANRALSFCLEKGAFISAIYFVINTNEKKITYVRAGHCPILMYRTASKQVEYLKDKGLALGMLRSLEYQQYIQSNELLYAPGDVMLLYTDGITETRNIQGEELGYKRLVSILQENATLSAKQIEDIIVKKLYDFSGSENINDDYTSMTIKFIDRNISHTNPL